MCVKYKVGNSVIAESSQYNKTVLETYHIILHVCSSRLQSLTFCPQNIVLNVISFTVVRDGPGSVVGIVTGYGLDSLGIKSQWGARFSAPVQTNPGAHPVSCTIGTGSFPGVKSSRGLMLTPHPLLVPWS